MVRGIGLEPTRLLQRQDLNLVRLPISPSPQGLRILHDFPKKEKPGGKNCEKEVSDQRSAETLAVSLKIAKRSRLYCPQVNFPFKKRFCKSWMRGITCASEC